MVGFCIISDVLLAACAVFGLAPIIDTAPFLLDLLKIFGVLFLLAYAFMSFKRALCDQTLLIQYEGMPSVSRTSIILPLAGFTWLNPHVWMDTIFLLGSVAQTQPDHYKAPFMIGACLTSILWFCLLGYGARILCPVFAKPSAWRILDISTGAVMCYLAVLLLLTD